jgi:hypothetical protein
VSAGRYGVGATYTAGRVFAVITRPLALFFANNYLARTAAENLAVAFLASAIALAASAADPHRQFYLRRFSQKQRTCGLSFYTYVFALALLTIFGSVIVLAVSLRFTGSAALSAAAVIYFASEKLADEHLRLRLFERNLPGWGRSMIARSVIQLAGLVLLVLLLGNHTPAWAAVLTLAMANLLVFVPQLPRAVGRSLRRLKTMSSLMGRGWRLLRSSFVLWAFALLSAGVGYLDRLLALVVDKSNLPLFMLIVMCFSIVQMAVDFYYVSPRRRDFLEQHITVSGALANRKFVMILGGGLFVAIVASVSVLWFSRNGADFPIAYVVLIALLQCALAIVVIPQQILYWKDYLRQMLWLEIVFWTLFSCAALAGWWFDASLTLLLVAATACAFVRLALFIFAADSTRVEN